MNLHTEDSDDECALALLSLQQCVPGDSDSGRLVMVLFSYVFRCDFFSRNDCYTMAMAGMCAVPRFCYKCCPYHVFLVKFILPCTGVNAPYILAIIGGSQR